MEYWPASAGRGTASGFEDVVQSRVCTQSLTFYAHSAIHMLLTIHHLQLLYTYAHTCAHTRAHTRTPHAHTHLYTDDLLTLDNLLRQLSTVVHAWYIIGKHLNWSSECPPGADQGDWTGRPQCYGGGSGSAGAGRLHAVGRRHQPRV